MEFRRSFSTKLKMSLTPLIDLVFLLVVFFMLTTTFSVNEAINIGFANETVDVESGDRKSIMVFVSKDGLVSLEGKIMRPAQFREALRHILSKNKKRKIFMKSDSMATVQDIISVMDQIQLAGGLNITFLNDGGK